MENKEDRNITNIEHTIDVMSKAFLESATSAMGCVCFVFDNENSQMSSGFNAGAVDVGDVMIAIIRIAEKYKINLERLLRLMGNQGE